MDPERKQLLESIKQYAGELAEAVQRGDAHLEKDPCKTCLGIGLGKGNKWMTPGHLRRHLEQGDLSGSLVWAALELEIHPDSKRTPYPYLVLTPWLKGEPGDERDPYWYESAKEYIRKCVSRLLVRHLIPTDDPHRYTWTWHWD